MFFLKNTYWFKNSKIIIKPYNVPKELIFQISFFRFLKKITWDKILFSEFPFVLEVEQF